MMRKVKSLFFENQTVKQTFFKNTFWLTFGTGVSRTIRAGLVIAAARVLQTAGYGVFAYALSFAAFFTVFSDIGLSGLLTRELAKGKQEKERYLATTFYIKIFLVLASVLFTAFIGPFFTNIEEAKKLIPIVAFLTAFDSMRGFFFSVVRAYNKMEVESAFTIFTEIAITSLSALVLIFRPSSLFLTIAYTLGSGLGFLGIALYTRKIWIPAVKNFFDKSLIKPIFKSALPFAVMGLLGTFMINIDSVILGIFRSAEELGLYAVAQKPVQLLYLLPSLVSTSFFPLLSLMVHKGEKTKVENLVKKLTIGIFALSLPMTIGGVILGKELILLFFGARYIEATLTFQLLLLTLIPVFLGLIIGNVVFAYDMQKIFIKTTAIGAILNTALDFVFIPPYGIWGSAIATIIADVAANSYTWIWVNKIVRINIFKNSLKIIFSAVLMGLIVWELKSLGVNVLLILLSGVLTYFISLIALKEPLLKSIPVVKKLV